MKTVFLFIFLLACPVLLGMAVEKLYNPNQNTSFFERLVVAFPSGSMVMLLVAGICNISALYLHLDLTRATKLFAVLLIVLSTLCYLGLIFLKLVSVMSNTQNNKNKVRGCVNNSGCVNNNNFGGLLIFLGIIVTILLMMLTAQGRAYTTGDQTVETVNSFIASGKLFSINPLTGTPYTNGYPTRITLECLPLFYAILSNTFEVKSTVLVWNIMPTFWLVNGLCCFWRIGTSLFKNKRDSFVFYIICVFLILCTDKAFGAAGFYILHCAYRSMGVVVLLVFSWTLSVVLSRKKWPAILGIIVEPLVIALQFGVGSCFALVLITFILSKIPYFKRIGGMSDETIK